MQGNYSVRVEKFAERHFMYEHLETAKNQDNLRRVVVEPVSRVEGHGKVTLLLDAENKVQQARLHIVEFRGFERFIQGRPYRDFQPPFLPNCHHFQNQFQ